jgi:dihydropteridine reductase
MNRKYMKWNDSWTRLEDVSERMFRWAEGRDVPTSGSLVKLVTKDGKTDFVAAVF